VSSPLGNLWVVRSNTARAYVIDENYFKVFLSFLKKEKSSKRIEEIIYNERKYIIKKKRK
jgi:hypothetical protein